MIGQLGSRVIDVTNGKVWHIHTKTVSHDDDEGWLSKKQTQRRIVDKEKRTADSKSDEQ